MLLGETLLNYAILDFIYLIGSWIFPFTSNTYLSYLTAMPLPPFPSQQFILPIDYLIMFKLYLVYNIYF
jgi:hypothetical protein